jgi:hypothetical protein
MLAMQTGPIFPMKFDGIIQTIAIIRTKDIFISSGVDRIFIVIHGLTPYVLVRYWNLTALIHNDYKELPYIFYTEAEIKQKSCQLFKIG